MEGKKEEAVNSRKDRAGHDLIALTIFLKSCISTEHTHSVPTHIKGFSKKSVSQSGK